MQTSFFCKNGSTSVHGTSFHVTRSQGWSSEGCCCWGNAKSGRQIKPLYDAVWESQFFSRFVRMLTDLAVVWRILRQDSDFNQTRRCENACQEMKKSFSKSATFKYFDPQQPVMLRCDASSTGSGAVLFQRKQPVVYVSRALTKTKCNYCQLEKDMLAPVFGTNWFHLSTTCWAGIRPRALGVYISEVLTTCPVGFDVCVTML